MTTAKDVLKMIKDKDVKYVDLRFTDPRGKWQHVTFDVTLIEEETFAEGQMFDGSSIAGWKAINECDMKLMPDPATACIDPFFAETTLSLVCDVLEPTTGEPYNRDPRGIAKKAEGYVKSIGHRRHDLFRPGSRVLHLRRREVLRRALQHRLQARLRRVPDQHRHRLRRRQSRPPHRHQEGLFPGAAAGHRPGHALRDARRHGEDGLQGREAPPRSGVRPARARPEVLAAHDHGRPDADLQILHPPGRAALRQDRDLHAEADLRRQRLGHALPPVDLEGRQAGVRRRQIRRPVGDVPVLHRRHHQARQGDQRLHQPDHQLLQAAGAGLRGAGAARLFGAQPLGLLPHSVHHQPEGQARRGPLPRPAVQSLSRLCRDADGRPRRHQEQDRSGRRRWTRTSTTCRRRS